MKEIGGYFGLEQFSGEEYYPELVAVNNARNALLYILKARQVKKLYIPYFLCDSVSKMCDREGYAYEYYSIGKDLLPAFEGNLEESEYLYIVNFYGQIDNSRVIELKNKYKNIILDNVQAFFQSPIKGIDTVYSCRKFFGVPDGGYVATDARIDGDMGIDVSLNRMRHVLGRYDGRSASDYYSDFQANDEAFETLELRGMSKLTHNLLRVVDYKSVCKKRESNFKALHEGLGELNGIKPTIPVGPYAYPFYCKNGKKIRKELAQKKIFIATLWPNVLETEAMLERDLAANILPLPCDQRYDSEDMKRVVKEILLCLNI